MNLVIFLHSLSSGGAERVASTLANYWAENGWRVTVVTVCRPESDFYVLGDGVSRRSLGLAGESRHSLQAGLANLSRVLALRRVLSQERPDVAIGMMATANCTLAIAGRLVGIPAVGSERIHPPALPLGRVWELVRRGTYPLLAGLVAQTQDSAEWLRHYTRVGRVEVIPNPVQYPLPAGSPRVDMSEVREQLTAPRLLLAVGRLERQKGFERLLSGFAMVADRAPEWALVILGEGSLRSSLMQQAADLGVADRVALPGSVGNVGEWFEDADLYVLTSRFEGFPNTLLEAMAYGVPSVAVDCETGPREILRHEVDGLLVPQNDPDALVEALDRMMSDAGMRARCAARAKEVRERFAIDRIAGQWEALFRRVI